MIGGLFVGISIALLIEYSWYYKPNMKHHKILLKRLGDSYKREFEMALEEIGLRRMLQQMWFVDRYKKTSAI